MIDITELVAISILIIILFIGMIWLSLRIDTLEARQVGAPSHKDLADIRDRIAGLSGHVTALAERQSESNRMIRTIQQHLMEPDR